MTLGAQFETQYTITIPNCLSTLARTMGTQLGLGVLAMTSNLPRRAHQVTRESSTYSKYICLVVFVIISFIASV